MIFTERGKRKTNNATLWKNMWKHKAHLSRTGDGRENNCLQQFGASRLVPLEKLELFVIYANK